MLQLEGNVRAMGDETTDPKELTATTEKEPPKGLCKTELLISVDVHDVNEWILLLDWEEIFKKHCVGKVPPYNRNFNRKLRDGKDCSTELLLSKRVKIGNIEGCCKKKGMDGDKGDKMTGDFEYVPFKDNTILTEESSMNA
jgi:hypothetical protein